MLGPVAVCVQDWVDNADSSDPVINLHNACGQPIRWGMCIRRSSSAFADQLNSPSRARPAKGGESVCYP
jgi:hypothetical protein